MGLRAYPSINVMSFQHCGRWDPIHDTGVVTDLSDRPNVRASNASDDVSKDSYRVYVQAIDCCRTDESHRMVIRGGGD